MKKQPLFITAVVAIGLTALTAHAQTVFTISNAVDAEYRDGRFDDTNFDGTGDQSSVGGLDLATGGDIGAASSIGQLSAGGGRAREGAFWFDLPTIPTGESLDTATFRIFLANTLNDDATIGSLGPVSVFFDNSENDGSSGAAAGFGGGTDTGLDLVTNTSITGQYYEVDVTTIVATDYATDGTGQGFGPVSYFRLAMDNAQAFSSATGDNVYVFQGGDNTSPPELVISTIPEPSSFALLIAGVSGLLVLRRRVRR